MASCGSDNRERSGGSVTYVRDDGSLPEAEVEPEKPPKEPNAPAAARLLEAWDLNFLLIVMWGKVGYQSD